MWKKGIAFGICTLAGVFVASSGVPWPYATAQAGQTIEPGGAPAKIRSYYATGSQNITVIPSVPGENGFLLTDIVPVWEGSNDCVTFNLEQGGTIKGRFSACLTGTNSSVGNSIHFESGIVLTPGQPLDATFNVGYTGALFLTVSGRTF